MHIWLAILLNILTMNPAGTPPGVKTQEKVLVAAAADLRYAMDSLVALYTRMHPGAQVQVVYGSSGNFYQQILNGGPFDLFFSADMNYVAMLKEAGKVSGPVIRYGTGHLVIWSLHLDPSRGMAVLNDPTVKKIAIANPDHAPYGKRAVESLQYFHVYDLVKAKLVLGENISQTAQFASTGTADVGLIALSLALSPPMQQTGGKFWQLPDESHGPLDQGFALLGHGAGNATAIDFGTFVQSPQAKAMLERFGFH